MYSEMRPEHWRRLFRQLGLATLGVAFLGLAFWGAWDLLVRLLNLLL